MQKFEVQVLWLESSLGISFHQAIDNHRIPLTQYYFWPLSQAWEQLSAELDSKYWIPKKERIALLNTSSDIIKDWKKYRVRSTSLETVAFEWKKNVKIMVAPYNWAIDR